MDALEKSFPDRAALIAHVKSLSPGYDDELVSDMEGGRAAAEAALAQIDPHRLWP